MTIRNRYISIAAIFFVFILVIALVQNIKLDNKLEQLYIRNQVLVQDLAQVEILHQDILKLESENYIIRESLSEEKEVADNYRKLVGNYSGTDLISKSKEIERDTPLDFETAYVVAKYADTMNINVSLILSVMELESNFGQFEVGTSQDRGYMQIIPPTEEWIANTYGEKYGIEYNPDRIFDPEYNIGLASIYLSLLQNSYGDDYSRILSEYNRGPYNLQQYYIENNTYSTTYSEVVLSKENKYLALNY